MNDMEVTLQEMVNSQPLTVVTEGLFSPGEGSERPFISIPSPLELQEWSKTIPTCANLQGGEGTSAVGSSGLQSFSQGLVSAQAGLLGFAPFWVCSFLLCLLSCAIHSTFEIL